MAVSEELSDRELVARIHAARDNVGCYVWLLVPPIATAVCGMLWGALEAIGALIGAALVCQGFWQLRKRVPRIRAGELAALEIQRRYRIAGLDGYEAESVAELEREGGPDAILLFSSTGLPHGGHSFIRIQLADQAKAQIWSAPLPFDIEHGEHAAARLWQRNLQLTAAATARLRELIAPLTPEALEPPEHFVYDGLRCEAVVLQRNAPPLRTQLNMAGLPADLRTHPIARLLQVFLDLELAVTERPRRVIGSTSPWGDIEITEL